MDRITHREMRNQSAEVLRRVEAGESIEVTNNGRPAARIVPLTDDPISSAIVGGTARPARASLESLRTIRRASSKKSTAEIIEDSRGRW